MKNAKYYTSNATGDVYAAVYIPGNPFAKGEPHHPDDKPATRAAYVAAEKARALAYLRKVLKPGARVYTILRKKSASGMSRSISLFIIDGKDLACIDWAASRALGYPFDDKAGGLKVGGCGMDMGFHLVYSLGRTVWPNGTKKPHGTRNGEPDKDGGYALRHEWL